MSTRETLAGSVTLLGDVPTEELQAVTFPDLMYAAVFRMGQGGGSK
jgi:hypothetical protein